MTLATTRRFALLLGLALVVLAPVAGCGSAPNPNEERAAAISSTKAWVDTDDCQVLSDEYAKQWGDTTEEGRKECAKDTYKGLQAGEYTVGSATVNATTANVNLRLKPAGSRTYKLIKSGDKWQVDGVDESYAGKIGDAFPYRAGFTEDDKPIDEDLLIKVASVKDPAPAPDFAYGDRGKRWIRAQVKMTSNGPDVGTLSVDNFQLVDTRGHRYDARGYDYQPSLGNNAIKLTAKDSITGYVSFLIPKKAKSKEIRWNGTFSDDVPLQWRIGN